MFTMDITVSINSQELNTTIFGQIFKVASFMPFTTDFPLGWNGQLTSLKSNIFIHDSNLFDGNPPDVLLQPSTADPLLFENATFVQMMAGDLNKRMDIFSATPSSVNRSIRGVYLPSTLLPPPSVSDSVSGILYGFDGEYGTLIQSSASCYGEECNPKIVEILQSMVSTSTQKYCEVTPITSTIGSYLTFDMFITNSSISVRGVAASTFGIFNCSNYGNVGIRVSSFAPSTYKWPLNVFLSDITAATNLIRSTLIKSEGNIYGTLTIGNAIYTSLRSDLFGSSLGGIFVPDRELNLVTVNAIFTEIISTTETSYSTINDGLKNLFPISQLPELIATYTLSSELPTTIGFFQWFVHQDPNLKIYVSDDGSNITISIIYFGSSPIDCNDPSMSVLNQEITTLGNAVHTKYSSISNIPIPAIDCVHTTLSASTSALYASQIVITNLESVSMVSEPQMSYVINANAQFTSSQLFATAIITSDLVNAYSTIKATFVSSISSQLGVSDVALDEDGNVCVDNVWTNAYELLPFFGDVLMDVKMTNWTYQDLTPFMVNFGQVGSSTWDQILTQMMSTFSDFDNHTDSFVIAAQLAAVIEAVDNSDSMTVIANVVPNVDYSLFVHITVFTLENASITRSGTIWERNLDTNRLKVPVIFASHLQFLVSTTQGQLQRLSVSGQSQLDGWTLPFLDGMILGSVRSSSLQVSATLPTSFTLEFSMKIQSEFGGLIEASLSDELITGSTTYDLDLEMDNRFSPETVTAILQDGVFQIPTSILTYPLNIIIPPLTQPLSSVDYFGSMFTNQVAPWMNAPGNFNPLLVTTNYFCSNNIVNTWTVNATVNTFQAVNCVITFDTDTIDDVSASINSGFANCGLSEFLVSLVYNQSSPQCGNIAFYPATPGVLYNFDISTSGAMTFMTHWSPSYLPIFGNWRDLGQLLSALYNVDYLFEPTVSQIPTDQVPFLVPPILQSVYPEQLYAVSLEISVKSPGIVSTSMVQQIETVNGMNLNSNTGILDGSIDTTLSVDLFAIFDLPPPGGGANISISSNLQSNESAETPVPEGNNTITLIIQAQLRNSTNSVTPINIVQSLTLTPGQPLIDALASAIDEQMDPQVAPMIGVDMTIGNQLLNIEGQIQISLSRYQIAEDVWLIPFGIGVQESTLPYFISCFNAPQRPQIIASNLNVETIAVMTPTMNQVNGNLGIVDLEGQGTGGITNISINTRMTNGFDSLVTLVNGATIRSVFFNYFDSQISIDTAVSIDSISLNVSNTVGNDGQIQLKMQTQTTLSTLTDLADLISDLEWVPDFLGNNVLDTLAQMNSSSLCSWMNMLANVDNQLSTQSTVNSLLPFSSKSFNSLWTSGLGSLFEDLVTGICSKQQVVTINLFCGIIKTSFGSELCAQAELTENSLIIQLELFNWTQTYHDQFRLNTPKLFGDSKLPLGVGVSSDLIMTASSEFTIELVAEFSSESFQLSLGPSTSFNVSASFDATGKMATYFGPLSIMMADLDLTLGNPATLSIRPSENVISVTFEGEAQLDTALLLLGSTLCQIEVTVTDLKAFLEGDMSPPVVQIKDQCPKGFQDSLQNALDSNPLFNYFSQPGIMVSQFSDAISDFEDEVFELVGDFVVPLIDRAIANMVKHELGNIVGPEITKLIIAELTEVTNGLLMNGTFVWNETIVDQILLDAVTRVLCYAFQEAQILISCPPSPQVGDQIYEWPFVLGRIYKYQLEKIDFDLGNHGLASLSMDCSDEVELDWELKFTLYYSTQLGIGASFNQTPVFQAGIEFELDPGCKLGGYLLFLGVEMFPTVTLSGNFIVESLDSATVDISAKVEGITDLGLAGPLAEKIAENSDSIRALPHYRAMLLLEWNWNLDNQVNSPYFAITNVEVCLGELIGHMINDFVSHSIGKILSDFSDIIGPNGLLMRKVEATQFILGRQLTVIELIQLVVDHYCSGDCIFDGVFEAVETFAQVFDDVENILQVLEIDPEGCGILAMVSNFTVDFSQPNVQPTITGAEASGLSFSPNISPGDQDFVANVFFRWNTSDIGIHIDFLDNIPQKIVALLLGEQIPLVGITIPPMTMGAGAYFGVVVWTPPTITLFVGMNAAIVVDIQEISLTSAGVVAAIQTGNIGKLFGGIGIPTQNPDGTPHWPLQGYVKLYGGVDVSLWLIDGGAYVYIQLTGTMGFTDPNGDGWITFDEIIWLIRANGNIWASLSKGYQLSAGFGLYLRICINYIFGHKCWTLAQKQWSAVIMQWEYTPNGIPPICSPDGTINLDNNLLSDVAARQDFSNLIRVYDSPVDGSRRVDGYVAGYTEGTGPLSSTISPSTTISYSGSLPDYHTFQLLNVHSPVYLPPGAALQVSMSSYIGASTFSVSQSSITSDSGASVQIQSCNQVTLQDAIGSATVNVYGVICPTSIESDTGDVVFSGTPNTFPSLTTVTGNPETVQSTVEALSYQISSTAIEADSQFSASFPYGTPFVQVLNPNTDDTIYDIIDVAYGSVTQVSSSSGWDTFYINNCSMIDGLLSIDGAGGVNEINMTLYGDAGLQVTATPTVIIQKDLETSTSHLIMWANIQRRKISLIGSEDSEMTFTLVSPEADAHIETYSYGAAGAAMTLFLTGCDAQSDPRYFMDGGGVQTVVIGSNNQLNSFLCNLRIYGSSDPNEVDVIVIQASQDTRALRWTMVAGVINILDENTGLFSILHQDIERVVINFGSGGSAVDFEMGTVGTEFVLEFPEPNQGIPNSVRIASTTNTVLVNGTFEYATIGPDSLVPVNPMDGIYAMIALNAQDSSTLVTLNSGAGNNAPSQYFYLNSSCLDGVDGNGTVAAMNPFTSWMQQVLEENGFPNVNCHVSYLGSTSFQIETGDGDDYFKGTDVDVPVSVSVSKGTDMIIWSNAGANAIASFDSGIGADTFLLIAPTSTVNGSCGADEDVDLVTIYDGDMRPPPQLYLGENSLSVEPTGPTGSNSVSLQNFYSIDLVYLRRGTPPTDGIEFNYNL